MAGIGLFPWTHLKHMGILWGAVTMLFCLRVNSDNGLLFQYFDVTAVQLSWKWLRGKGAVFGGSDICYLRWFLSMRYDCMSGMMDASICLV